MPLAGSNSAIAVWPSGKLDGATGPNVREYGRMNNPASGPAVDDVNEFSAYVPIANAYMIFIAPLLAALWLYSVTLLLALYSVVWTFVVAPIDTQALLDLMWAAVDTKWWTDVSIAMGEQSAWVLPSLLATVLGLGAGIYAVPRPAARRRLGAFATVVALGASAWAWLAVPGLWLGGDVVIVWAGLLVGATIAIVGGEAAAFVSARLTREQLIERISARDLDGKYYGPPAWRKPQRAAWPLAVAWLAGGPAFVSVVEWICFEVANQGGLGAFLIATFLIAAVIVPIAWFSAQPIGRASGRRSVVGLLARLGAAGLVLTILVATSVRFFDVGARVSEGSEGLAVIALAHLIWALALIVAAAPAWRSRLPSSRGALERLSLAGAARDLMWLRTETQSKRLREAFAERFPPPEPEVSPRPGAWVHAVNWLRRRC